MLSFTKLPFKDVKTSDFGKKKVTIRVNAESVRHYARKVKLLLIVDEMKLESEDDDTAYRVAAGLMSICTDPKTDEYSFNENQLSDFVHKISGVLFTDLSYAHSKVNPSWFIESDVAKAAKTMTAKKKST